MHTLVNLTVQSSYGYVVVSHLKYKYDQDIMRYNLCKAGLQVIWHTLVENVEGSR